MAKDVVITLGIAATLFFAARSAERADQLAEAQVQNAHNDCVETLFDAAEAQFERSQAVLFVALAVEGLGVEPPEAGGPLPTLVEALDQILERSVPPTEEQIAAACSAPPG